MEKQQENWHIFKEVPWRHNVRRELRHFGTRKYLVSDLGRVKMQHFNLEGQFVKERPIRMHWKGRTKKYLGIPTGEYVHRLVAQAFIPNLNGCTNVTFIDNDLTNLAYWNLMWTNQRKMK